METNITSQTETEAQMTITLNEAYLKPIKAEVFDDLRRRVRAAGFRPGKAPDMIVERELGSDAVQTEFMEQAVQRSYTQAVREQKLQVVASPRVNLEKFVPYTELQYKATVELLPKVKLTDYKKFKIKRQSIKVDAAEVNKTLEELRRRQATRLDSEQPAKKGDEVDFDFDGTKDGQPVPGASAKGHTLLLGSGDFIPGFEDKLVGLRKDQEKSFDIRFPKDYHEQSLAHQTVTFKVKINTVTDLVLPELDQAFVEQVSPYQSLDELKGDITTRITTEKAEAAARQYENEVLNKLLKESHYKVPESLVQQQFARMRGELEQNLAASGLDIQKYLELTKKTAEDMEQEMRPEAERRVGLAMLLTEVAAQENLTLGATELDAEIARLKHEYPDPSTQAELDKPATREEVYNHLMSSKVVAKLVEYAER